MDRTGVWRFPKSSGRQERVDMWTASSEFGTYRLCEQRRFRRACASAQSRQNLRGSLIKAVSQEEPSDRKPDPWPRWMAGHAQLKFVMTECSKTQIRLALPMYCCNDLCGAPTTSEVKGLRWDEVRWVHNSCWLLPQATHSVIQLLKFN